MRIFVAGSSGQLARAIRQAASDEATLRFAGRPELDLAGSGDLGPLVGAWRPDIVINAAAYTQVDRAETEPESAFAINRDGAARLAAAAAGLGVPFIHVSTDYVFDGDAGRPYGVGDAPRPLGIYGRSKAEGEAAVLAAHPGAAIVRTGWVYSPHGSNFATTITRLARQRDRLDIVADRFGSPTQADDLAAGLLRLATCLARGDRARSVYHLAGADDASWMDLAAGIVARLAERDIPAATLQPIAGADYPAAALRPVDSRLDSSALFDDFGIALAGFRQRVAATVDAILDGEAKA